MHTLIVGQSQSGKSTLAKLLAAKLHTQGKLVAVCDPLIDPAWVCTYHTDDVAELWSWSKQNRSAFIFVDEGGEVFNEGRDKTYIGLATRSRHFGHSVTFISQRGIQVPKTMRDQCERLFLFTSSRSDGKVHAEEWNKDELERCNELPQMSFWLVDRFTVNRRLRIEGYSEIVDDTGPMDSDVGNACGVVDGGRRGRKVGKGKGKQ